MANNLHLLVIISLIGYSLQSIDNNEVKVEESDPYADVVSKILEDQNAKDVGAIVQNFLQGDGANLLSNVLSNLGSEQAGQLLQGLGTLLVDQKKTGRKGDADSDSPLGNAKDLGNLLQGFGSLLGDQQGGPSVVGTLLNTFSQMQQNAQPSKKGKPGKSGKPGKDKQGDGEIDMGNLFSMAGNLVGMLGQGNSQGGFPEMLQMLLQTVNAFTGPEAQRRAESHSEHSHQLPPILERLHLAFDHFIHADVGKYVINALGAEKAFSVFKSEKGNFDYKKFGELMENTSFRRHWIRLITERVVSFLQYASDPKVYKQYLSSGHFFLNSYLKAQGFPKSTMFDPKKPVETISAFVNHAAKSYFQIKINSKEYVKPAVEYVQELLRLSEKKGPLGNEAKELGNKIADTLNLEIIEPLARVNRAYRFAQTEPKCARYVLCLVNQDSQDDVESLPGLKKILNKGASLMAGWYLSSQHDTSFWNMYTDITENTKCKRLYRSECDGFHEEELRVTTEYVHSEL